MNYYQSSIKKPSKQLEDRLFFETLKKLQKKGINACVDRKRLSDLYSDLSKLPRLGNDSSLIFNRTIEIAIDNVLRDLKHVFKPSYQTILITTGLNKTSRRCVR